MLNDQAILFPEIYERFILYLPTNLADVSESASKTRVLAYIGNTFGELLSSTYSHRKIGQFFYRTGSNLHVLLSHALDASRKQAQAKGHKPQQHLNAKLHELACKLVDLQSSKPSSATDLDLNAYINQVTAVAPGL